MSDRSRSSSPLELPTDTLAILNQFLAESKAQEDAREAFVASEQPKDLDVDEFRKLFPEDWQVSQFWYSKAFADRLAKALHNLCMPDTKIAFLCSPTAYVAFQHHKHLEGAYCFEYDQRFESAFRQNFVHYDLHQPEKLPESLLGVVDIAVVDPPFLNEDTNLNVATSLRKLLHANSKFILLTSTSLRSILPKVYHTPPVGPLRETDVKVEHQGGQLQNPFGLFTNFAGFSLADSGDQSPKSS